MQNRASLVMPAAASGPGHRRSMPRSILRLPRGESRGCYITHSYCAFCRVSRAQDAVGRSTRADFRFATGRVLCNCVPKSGKQPPRLHTFLRREMTEALPTATISAPFELLRRCVFLSNRLLNNDGATLRRVVFYLT